MGFRTRMLAHRASVFLNTDHFAEEVTYTPVSGSVSTPDAVVDRQPMPGVEEAGDGNQEVRAISVAISDDDVTAPARGDVVAVTEPDDSTGTYKVDGWSHADGMWTLFCVRQTQREIHGAGARG